MPLSPFNLCKNEQVFSKTRKLFIHYVLYLPKHTKDLPSNLRASWGLSHREGSYIFTAAFCKNCGAEFLSLPFVAPQPAM